MGIFGNAKKARSRLHEGHAKIAPVYWHGFSDPSPAPRTRWPEPGFQCEGGEVADDSGDPWAVVIDAGLGRMQWEWADD